MVSGAAAKQVGHDACGRDVSRFCRARMGDGDQAGARLLEGASFAAVQGLREGADRTRAVTAALSFRGAGERTTKSRDGLGAMSRFRVRRFRGRPGMTGTTAPLRCRTRSAGAAEGRSGATLRCDPRPPCHAPSRMAAPACGGSVAAPNRCGNRSAPIQLAFRTGGAIALPQIIEPGRAVIALGPRFRIGDVACERPAIGAVALTAEAAHPASRCERRGLVLRHAIFDLDHQRA